MLIVSDFGFLKVGLVFAHTWIYPSDHPIMQLAFENCPAVNSDFSVVVVDLVQGFWLSVQGLQFRV